MGGYNYLRNLITVLAQYQSSAIRPVLFCGDDISAEELIPFRGIQGLEIYQNPIFNQANKFRSLMKAVFLGRDNDVHRLFESAKIDVIFEVAHFYGWRVDRPVVAWIADFQHRLLPSLFSWSAKLHREIGFRCQIASNRRIMLSSEDSRVACHVFYPQTIGRTSVVRFAVKPGVSRTKDEGMQIVNSYGLPKHFFYMPNQFWKHKNHDLVIDALKTLMEEGVEGIAIVASGSQADPRNPNHFSDLLAKMKSLGVQDQFYLLGLIPYGHISALMHASDGLLNPSLFEGWSTTVEEAKAMGIPLILSDLAVHKEQAGDGAIYFDRTSSKSLANALKNFPAISNEERDKMCLDAERASQIRIRLFAEDFLRAVESALVCPTSKSQ